MTNRYKLASVLLSASLVMAACGDNEDISEDTNDEISEDSSAEETEVDEIVEEGEGDTSMETVEDSSNDEPSMDSDSIAAVEDIPNEASEAIDAASGDFDGELKELEFENEDGQWVYKVDMENESEEYEATLSAEDLSIIEAETDGNDGYDMEEHLDYNNLIAAEEAIQTAMDENGGELESWTLSTDDGQPEYEIELTDGDVTIDAQNGEILETDD
ncbi:PepSY domain-containing protein [Salinicoccus sesuvii]|uniref:PepSY domain-containing protein n=1 Tax=Salinicoccus sesuvii TaxID=868281 RepID=A0ABV7N0J2_9STAP